MPAVSDQALLGALQTLAPCPQPRETDLGVRSPLAPGFSGFVFKIQANMDPKHRDRIAFLRVCSGRFERGVVVTHGRTGKPFATKYAHSVFGQERETLEDAYPGDVVGLHDVSLRIDSGEFVFLVGPSGSGKSTFIRLLIKELDATSGTVTVGGRDLTRLRRSRVPYLRRAIGCVFQDYRLLPTRTAYENVAYALQVTGSSPRVIRRKVPEILALVGLADKADRLPNELSGGEQQRVSIARAFVNHPRLLIADEPTGNLDPETSVGIMQLLYRINRTGTTVIVATHDRDMVDRMQMRVVALEGGRLVRDQRQARYAAVDG